jgi:hypothetical protein
MENRMTIYEIGRKARIEWLQNEIAYRMFLEAGRELTEKDHAGMQPLLDELEYLQRRRKA